ncbi:MAG: hypothetical protein K0S74_857 [Chlamydiales bacterium]|jgi:hypothetical protein|nr:hypothetical protein [Chlamydiales bacterium]
MAINLALYGGSNVPNSSNLYPDQSDATIAFKETTSVYLAQSIFHFIEHSRDSSRCIEINDHYNTGYALAEKINQYAIRKFEENLSFPDFYAKIRELTRREEIALPYNGYGTIFHFKTPFCPKKNIPILMRYFYLVPGQVLLHEHKDWSIVIGLNENRKVCILPANLTTLTKGINREDLFAECKEINNCQNWYDLKKSGYKVFVKETHSNYNLEKTSTAIQENLDYGQINKNCNTLEKSGKEKEIQSLEFITNSSIEQWIGLDLISCEDNSKRVCTTVSTAELPTKAASYDSEYSTKLRQSASILKINQEIFRKVRYESYDAILELKGKQRIPVNKAFLIASSQFFKDFFAKVKFSEQSPILVIKLDYILSEHMQSILEFMYTGYVGASSENILELLRLADVLQMEDLGNILLEEAYSNLHSQINPVQVVQIYFQTLSFSSYFSHVFATFYINAYKESIEKHFAFMDCSALNQTTLINFLSNFSFSDHAKCELMKKYCLEEIKQKPLKVLNKNLYKDDKQEHNETEVTDIFVEEIYNSNPKKRNSIEFIINSINLEPAQKRAYYTP